MIDALLCTGFPYTVQEDADYLVGLFGDFLRRARAVRRLGSAAIDLCYVAAGRLDGFWEQKLQPVGRRPPGRCSWRKPADR